MSDSDMLKAAEAEVKRLEAEIAKSPLGQKLALARQVVALYRNETTVTFAGVVQGMQGLARLVETVANTTKTARIEAAAVQHLKATGRRATSGELLPVVVDAGIEITGKEPAKALSAYLSGSSALNNIREKGGYGLAEWGDNAGPILLTKTGAEAPVP
ncbi:hypothetical protein GPL21_27040 [Bradyrhizobium pachyrhizi]|uniref:Uncharacterized protein n=1 Tax=Bradyrhizobium pachyrhizi TaxID=280333 RepID=A0A844SNM5_9BRAD|nr:hypothetical protein [Bradyrhizobium pachyrhizi]MVT68753.1 hypothetical protein [Bradyrhizobium pachyrhizi]